MSVTNIQTANRSGRAEAAMEKAAPARKRVRLAFLIRSLDVGGAEKQMVALAKALDPSLFDVSVLTFYGGGALEADLEAANIPLVCVGKSGRWDVLGFVFRLWRQMRALRPDIIHGYMGTSNVLATILRPFLGRTMVVWGIRASNMDLSQYDWVSRVGFPLECRLSRFADLIVVNSQAGRSYHVEHGYPADRITVIPNGIDVEQFRPDREAGLGVRSGWGIPNGVPLIGMVARLDPMKDHATFLEAASRLSTKRADVRFVCVGDGAGDYAERIYALASELGLGDRLIWAGARGDMPAVYNAFDIATLSSVTEGLPNVVAEAMACGVPCVVTDAGDSGWLVGDTGVVVPIRDPDALAEGWSKMLDRQAADAAACGAAARRRICECFSTSSLREATEAKLLGLLPSEGKVVPHD